MTKITNLKSTVSIFSVTKFDKERNLFIRNLLTRKTGENKLLYLIKVAWNLPAYFTKHINCKLKHFLILCEFKMFTCSIIPINL